MLQGTVQWFDDTKGFGFIARDDGGPDIFVHRSAVQAAGLHTLDANDRVSFDLGENRGRKCAINLSLARAAA